MVSFSEAFKGKQGDLLELIDLQPGSVLLTKLRAAGILTNFQIDAIQAILTNVDKIDKMLTLLGQKDDKFLPPFIEALRKSGMDRAADLILEPRPSTTNISTDNAAAAGASIRGQTNSSFINSATTAIGNMSVGSVGTAQAYQVQGATGGWANSSTSIGGTPVTYTNFSSGSVQTTLAYQVQDTMEDPIPTVMFGELQQLQKIGEGGFGDVYRGWHPVLKDIAYKQLKISILPANSKTAKAMRQEAAAHTLRHPNIVIMRAMVFEDGHYGAVFEFVKFGGLDKFVDEFDVGWFGLMSFAGDIARGMTYLHGKKPTPVVHGDIKIQNALVGEEFVAKMCDFGLSKWTAFSTLRIGSQSGRPGTITNISPEVWDNISAQRTVKYDIYGFGIFLWELFSHMIPFAAVAGRADLVSQAVKGGQRPAPVDAIRGTHDPFMPDNMFQLVNHYMQLCWAQDPTGRPPIADVSGEFDKFLQHNITEVDAEKARLSTVTAQHV